MNLNLIKEKIENHALEDVSVECCGIILPNNKVIKLNNKSKNPKNHFILDQSFDELKDKYGKIEGYYHSHPAGYSDFSLTDKIVSEYIQIPAILYSIGANELKIYNPVGINIPYENRPFQPYIFDCYSIVKDYFSRELNINLTELNCIERDELDKFPDVPYNHSGNLTVKNHFSSNGFTEIKGKLQKNDVILCKSGDVKFACHCLVYLGNDIILHQPFNDVSKKENLKEYWKNRSLFIMRHNHLL